jgi:hypothetical protein
MTSERHRCRVLRRRIEALELAGDPAPTTPRCFNQPGQAALRQRLPHVITSIAAPPRTSCDTLRARHRPRHRRRAVGLPRDAPGCRRQSESQDAAGAPAASGEAGAGLAEGTTGCLSRPSGSARLGARRVGARAWAPVELRARPPEPHAIGDSRLWLPAAVSRGPSIGAVTRGRSSGRPRRRGSIAERPVPQRTLGYFRARGMVRNGECLVEHTPTAAGRRLAND